MMVIEDEVGLHYVLFVLMLLVFGLMTLSFVEILLVLVFVFVFDSFHHFHSMMKCCLDLLEWKVEAVILFVTQAVRQETILIHLTFTAVLASPL